MDAYSLMLVLLIAQGVVGGLDTIVNHELIERLPADPSATQEIGFHAMREAIYAILFGGFAWFAWEGTAAAIIAGVMLAEVGVTACDEWIENRTRVLPQNERILHVFLTINLGFLIAVATPILLDAWPRKTALVPSHHGMMSWILSSLALAAAAWSVRDLFAWLRLRGLSKGLVTGSLSG